jgi:hypothetical protein
VTFENKALRTPHTAWRSRERSADGHVVRFREPTTMPWGNLALLFRDPDGNLVNLFAPVTKEARVKFGV